MFPVFIYLFVSTTVVVLNKDEYINKKVKR